jgi:DNA sulfur modification protein DndB
LDQRFGYVFPAIRGIQAGREYYVSMCPLRLIPKIFLFNEDELVPELRAQRILNRARVPEIARYITDNRKNYIFSALTASIDGSIRFEALGADAATSKVGVLHIPMEAPFIINDGQHRRAAIEVALKECPELADETIAVVFFHDLGLARSQQMFADLNRHAIRPAKSLGLLYDHRDDTALLAREVALLTNAFKGMVEMESSTLSARSRKLFTLSAIHSATRCLLAGYAEKDKLQVATAFWDAVGKQFPEWEQVREGKVTAGDIRRDYLHSHGISLQAIGRVGSQLLTVKGWPRRLERLRTIDWARNNTRVWEGRALAAGRVSKATTNVMLTANLIKQHLGLKLSADENEAEQLFVQGRS